MLTPLLRPALALLCALALAACHEAPRDSYPGYVEADYVRVASPIGGALARLHVRRGDLVAAGAPLFALEQESERAARQEAQSRLERAEALLADLQKGSRPAELAVIAQQLAQAQAAQALSQAELARQSKLLEAKFIAPARIDEARAALRRDQARVAELQARAGVARMGARSDALDAARQDIGAARAQLAQADWKLAQKTLKAPLAASVADVLFREGELVPAGAPVASLLGPEHLRARFFVPQALLGTLALGQQVSLSCDGCKGPLPATLSFIAREAEYTAPIIYSKENRATLVFLVEAQPSPDVARTLHPGQPLEVRLGPIK
jgi:HlyD family secretion protein